MPSRESRLTRRSALKHLGARRYRFSVRDEGPRDGAPPARHCTTPASAQRGWRGPTSARSRPARTSSSSPWPTSTRRNLDRIKDRFPGVKVYQDWRELLDKEKNLNSVNVSTPDHMHASITMRALQQGLNVYTQKPLTQTIYEARQVARVAREKKLVTQMGIQIHSHEVHRTIVATIQAGTIGKVKEVHSWSGKHWGDNRPKPDRNDPIPAGLNWDFWLGVAAERPYLARLLPSGRMAKTARLRHRHIRRHGLPHPRPGFHLAGADRPAVDPIRRRCAQGRQLGARLASALRLSRAPRTRPTRLSLTWYDGDKRPPADVKTLIGKRELADQGSIYIGTKGVLYAPYIDASRAAPRREVQGRKAAQSRR